MCVMLMPPRWLIVLIKISTFYNVKKINSIEFLIHLSHCFNHELPKAVYIGLEALKGYAEYIKQPMLPSYILPKSVTFQR